MIVSLPVVFGPKYANLIEFSVNKQFIFIMNGFIRQNKM